VFFSCLVSAFLISDALSHFVLFPDSSHSQSCMEETSNLSSYHGTSLFLLFMITSILTTRMTCSVLHCGFDLHFPDYCFWAKCFFFGRSVYSGNCQILNWIIVYLLFSYLKFFITFWMLISCQMNNLQIFPPVLWVDSSLLIVSFVVQKHFSMIQSYLSIFFLPSFSFSPFLLVGLRLELRVLHLQSRCFTVYSTPLVHFALVVL
jgi:hypothetical protein